jgi:hypothetical protein
VNENFAGDPAVWTSIYFYENLVYEDHRLSFWLLAIPRTGKFVLQPLQISPVNWKIQFEKTIDQSDTECADESEVVD